MTQEGTPAEAVMLGFDGFRIVAARPVDGELELDVETTAERDWCRACGVRAHSKGRHTVRVRDVDSTGRCGCSERKRRWRCPEPVCAAATWTEQSEAIGPRRVLTERARRRACRQVGAEAHSVASVARELGCGWHTIMDAVVDHGQPKVDDPARTRRGARAGRG